MSAGRAEVESLERPIKTAGQLVVEGRGAEMFFREFVADLGLSERLDVRTFGDINRGTLRAWLELFTRNRRSGNECGAWGSCRTPSKGQPTRRSRVSKAF